MTDDAFEKVSDRRHKQQNSEYIGELRKNTKKNKTEARVRQIPSSLLILTAESINRIGFKDVNAEGCRDCRSHIWQFLTED